MSKSKNKSEMEKVVDAIKTSMAVIEFTPDGLILNANDNFLKTLGYSLDEINGKHHRIFCDSSYAQSIEYKNFWEKLNQGNFDSGEYKRIAKDGSFVWISASYNPLLDSQGKVYKVIKFASDISQQKLKDAELDALSKTQAVINFNLDGTIINANDNFLKALGYSLEAIQGKHHRIFCDPKYAQSAEYRLFWENLRSGQFQAGEFERIARNGDTIWINAAYNPVYDLEGKIFKIVKYATDVTAQKKSSIKLIKTLGETSVKLSSTSEKLSTSALQFAENAKRTTSESVSVSSSSNELFKSIHSVAESTKEMTSAIRDITMNTNNSSQKAHEALKKAQQTNQLVNKLQHASEEIGSVIKSIASIAQQTNLLALNATIEAARAGEAGKGFAVVASEVKELAKQSANSSSDIEEKISNIQETTSNAVLSISEISTFIGEISSISSTIAAAVEQQASTTNEVSRNIQNSSTVVENVSKSIQGVSDAALASSSGADKLTLASNELKDLSLTLIKLVKELSSSEANQ